jgi:hypothetical protein
MPTSPSTASPSGIEAPLGRGLLAVAGAASAAAALVHAAAAGTHGGDNTVQVLFAVCAVVQVGWGALAVVRPSRLVAVAGAALNTLAVAAWGASRTVGLPAPDALREVEDVGGQDALAAALAALAVIGAVTGLLVRRSGRPSGAALARLVAAGAVGVLVTAVPAMAADHGGGPSHSHTHADGVTASHGDGSSADGEPIISLDDPRVTPAQRTAAQELMDETTAAVAGLTDLASLQAAGYAPRTASVEQIVDQFASVGGGPLHLFNQEYMDDGREIDPRAVESMVLNVTPDGNAELVAAMYVLEPGKTMDDAPDIAGELTTWHQDHGDAARSASGQPKLPPMMHVWLVDQPCGPFAGTDGLHETDCTHSHE